MRACFKMSCEGCLVAWHAGKFLPIPVVSCSISIHSQKETQYTFELDKALREEDNPFIMVSLQTLYIFGLL